MNERIKQLVEQAQYYANEQNDKHGVSWIRTYNEKFAELIIEQCVQVCTNEGKTYAIKSAGEYTSNLYATAIKEHFGVEEGDGL